MSNPSHHKNGAKISGATSPANIIYLISSTARSLGFLIVFVSEQ
jgi:hypothetical protein